MTKRAFVAHINSRVAATSVAELATELKVSRQTIYNWQAGKLPSKLILQLIEQTAKTPSNPS